MDSSTTTMPPLPAPPPPPAIDGRRASIDNALTNVRAAITRLDDEATPALGWGERDEVIRLLRDAVKELRKL